MRDWVVTDVCASDKKIKQISKINIDTNLPSGQIHFSKVFRKPKKAIKMFPIQSQAAFSDRSLIGGQLKGRVLALTSNSNGWKKSIKTEEAYIPLSERAKQKIFDIYSDIRKNQMCAVCSPFPQRKQSNIKKETLKLHVSDVQKIRSRTQIKKIVVPQSLFKDTLPCKISYSVGFKGQGFKPLEKVHSSKKQVIVSEIQKQDGARERKNRNRSQESLHLMQSQLNRMLRKSTKNNVCSPKIKGQYRSKSRLKNIWETIAFHKHNNSTNE